MKLLEKGSDQGQFYYKERDFGFVIAESKLIGLNNLWDLFLHSSEPEIMTKSG